jgi:adenosylhomocysteine nucleosidase
MQERVLGIMGAMPEEVHGVAGLLDGPEIFSIGMRDYYVGRLNGIKTVVVFSRWGKVAAAATVTTLILRFQVTDLVFTGVAGALHPELNIGDIVIARRLIQHDLDARPLMREFEIPLLGVTSLEIQPEPLKLAEQAVRELLEKQHLAAAISTDDLRQFNITQPKLLIGDIASGDKFFANSDDKHALLARLPSVLCVEMEGAAVAQVCHEYGVSCTVIRTISDAANEQSAVDFPAFIGKIANKYSIEIVKNLVREISGSK